MDGLKSECLDGFRLDEVDGFVGILTLTAKMARVVHAVIKGGAEYRPFFERPVPGGRTSLCVGRKGAQATL
ncbi:hypothetical protein [Microvirga lotononidis]|nr:hypothetical protein U0023_28275 [Microvirga lotononidis]